MSGDNYNPDSVDATLARIEANQMRLEGMIKDAMVIQSSHGEAIQSLNQWKWYLTGIASIISIGASKFADFFTGSHK